MDLIFNAISLDKLKTTFISWIDGSEEQFKLVRRDSLALNLTEDKDGTFNTPEWYNMALVASWTVSAISLKTG